MDFIFILLLFGAQLDIVVGLASRLSRHDETLPQETQPVTFKGIGAENEGGMATTATNRANLMATGKETQPLQVIVLGAQQAQSVAQMASPAPLNDIMHQKASTNVEQYPMLTVPANVPVPVSPQYVMQQPSISGVPTVQTVPVIRTIRTIPTQPVFPTIPTPSLPNQLMPVAPPPVPPSPTYVPVPVPSPAVYGPAPALASNRLGPPMPIPGDPFPAGVPPLDPFQGSGPIQPNPTVSDPQAPPSPTNVASIVGPDETIQPSTQAPTERIEPQRDPGRDSHSRPWYWPRPLPFPLHSGLGVFYPARVHEKKTPQTENMPDSAAKKKGLLQGGFAGPQMAKMLDSAMKQKVPQTAKMPDSAMKEKGPLQGEIGVPQTAKMLDSIEKEKRPLQGDNEVPQATNMPEFANEEESLQGGIDGKDDLWVAREKPSVEAQDVNKLEKSKEPSLPKSSYNVTDDSGASEAASMRPKNVKSTVRSNATAMQTANIKYYKKTYNDAEWVRLAPEPPSWTASAGGHGGEHNLCINNRLVPEFYVLGPMLSGTTSMCLKLRRSPSLIWPRTHNGVRHRTNVRIAWKEGHFFDMLRMKSRSIVLSEYATCQKDRRQVAVEATARYAIDPYTARLVSSFYGRFSNRIKFLVMLREPLSRLQSHFYHSKQNNWCADHAKQTFAEAVDVILAGDDKKYLGGSTNPHGAGCGDFLEGSMYTHHLKRWFKEFDPTQFTIMPFYYNAEPGEEGRPGNKDTVEYLWRQLGVHGLVGGPVWANQIEHPLLYDDLDPVRIAEMERYFEPKTGPLVLASLFTTTGVNMYDYVGTMLDVEKIAGWIRKHW